VGEVSVYIIDDFLLFWAYFLGSMGRERERISWGYGRILSGVWWLLWQRGRFWVRVGRFHAEYGRF